MNEVIASVGIGGWYAGGLNRLGETLPTRGEYDGEMLTWAKTYPTESPTHKECPYGFKYGAMMKAATIGRYLLWLDASMVAQCPVEPVFECIRTNGVMLFHCGFSVHQWCCDSAQAALGRSRDELKKIPLVVGGIWGVDIENEMAREFMERLGKMVHERTVFIGPPKNTSRTPCSTDKTVLGHRHDQVAMGVIAHDLKIPLISGGRLFSYWEQRREDTIFCARGWGE